MRSIRPFSLLIPAGPGPALLTRSGCIGLALCGLVWAAVSLGPAAAQSGLGTPDAAPNAPAAESDAPVHIMSDTPEFCVHLSSVLSRVQQRESASAASAESEVQVLAMAGRRMCADGHVRAGIQRLRRALMILHTGD